uniref:RRM domain-containing protein n=1 Tax=Eucampia antarctica TaxID=49252 RepID=A0A7S2R034_9STRA|mmetsp:Transcript_10797/g.10303  ORF Transcript_10797/g.10303 Transcript_10797/m.10303 type:complete len:406 (+) Transcript_10797:79-1296(+)|eukprot:CAMPEP_0197831978 /NCGR_PEP_ID=MMETSP1437-20131217/12880_1 /TAXON_ID=49252 ORGANISM="Eucampia antarctica, Strain CCMP1452" /NCGR_SAMPLE_ID=MMETSP1437 /ASSEMBLY_ACC=CAM_ASM_001096 /LENGTH=405 /DNA_ID=CAMNT_0043435133 /DNA_START=55 /DNA_END=1272 /DNA_ORIENTATION=-
MLVSKRSLLFLLSSGVVSAFTTQSATNIGCPSFVACNSISIATQNPIRKHQHVLFSDVSAADETPVTESVEVSTESAEVSTESVEVSTEPAEVSTESVEVSTESKKVSTESKEEKEKFTAYVVNMSYDTTEDTMRDVFSEYGTVTNIYLPTDKTSGRPRGFAFVSMSSQEELDKVLESIQEVVIDDRTVYVTKARSKSEKNEENKEDTTKIYVGNVNFDTTEGDLREYFGECGNVLDVYCPTHQDTGLPRGFAFVTMKADDAEKAIDQNDGQDFMGRNLSVRESLPRGQKLPQKPKEAKEKKDEVKLYIGNISFGMEEEDLTEVFEEYGTVLDLYMPRDRETGRPRGFAFCTMSSESSQKAMEGTDGYEMDGRILRVNEAQPKGYSPVDNSGSYDDEEGGEGGEW